MTEETLNLRKALIAQFFSKKNDKIQQKIQQKIDSSFKDWETILTDYINITTKINNMVQLAEQHHQVNKLSHLLRQCTELIKDSCDQFSSICDMIEVVLPMSNVNNTWMANILKQETRLGQMKESLSQVLMFSSNRQIIEIVQKTMLQVNEIQQKINFATNKVHDAMQNTMKNSSSLLNSMRPDFDDESVASIISNDNSMEAE